MGEYSFPVSWTQVGRWAVAFWQTTSVLLEQCLLVASCALSLKAAEKSWRKQPQVNWKKGESAEM